MSRSRFRFAVSVSAVFALVLGLAATAVLFAAVRHIEHEATVNDFRQRANVKLLVVKEALSGAVQGMMAVNQFFVTVEPVSREQFHTFTQPLLKRYPYIQAFNFHRILLSEERAAYEAAMRENNPRFVINELVDGALRQAGVKPVYNIVDYIEPLEGNEAALGLDVSSNVHHAEITHQAIDTGLPMATGLLQLAQGIGTRSGFLVVMPVYRQGAVVDSIEARRRAVIGDTAAVFRVGDLLQKTLVEAGLLNDPGIGISVAISDRNGKMETAFEYGRETGTGKIASLLPHWLLYDQIDNIAYDFELAGKPWRMVVSSRPLWFSAIHSGSLIGLIAGVLFSLVGAAYLQRLALRSTNIQRLVDERTAELRFTNEQLTEDIIARVRAEKALELRERAIQASANAIIIINATAPGYPVEYVNPAFERITGRSAAETLGRSSKLLLDGDTDQPGMAEIRATILEKREGNAVLQHFRKDGSPLWSDLHVAPVMDDSGKVTHFVVVQYDITATKRYEAELEFQANRDVLTGLANRSLLRDRLNQAIAYAGRYNHQVWVVYIDLDSFKFVNDTLGHKAGDLLLQAVSERLLLTVRETDTVARLGGDEFVLLLPEREDEHLKAGVVQRIMDVVARPLLIEGHEFFVTCSSGVAAYPADGDNAEMLVKHADIAMYRAKELGRNNFQFYTSAMNERALERLRIEGDLRNALERGEFLLHYQPQVDLHSGKIVGMEALIRWLHPELGMVSPLRFIGLAEETGLIIPIGAWVLRTACAQCQAWQQAGLGRLRIAVNLSARQFAQQDLVRFIADVLEDTGLDPTCLEIELTESLVMKDVERAIGVLRDLKSLGVHISVDDFGTGYSSLSYLKRFPIDVLKIDQSFVRDITLDSDDAAIVASIISLAHSLRLHVIAEGVETEEQLAYLRQHRCDEMQGYYFSRPVSASEFGQLLLRGKCLQPVASIAPLA
jgi:diguanylate cyclase (GGDEF)-like protein/PAS domain S-box-containing protein